jgi:hypothetical protein
MNYKFILIKLIHDGRPTHGRWRSAQPPQPRYYIYVCVCVYTYISSIYQNIGERQFLKCKCTKVHGGARPGIWEDVCMENYVLQLCFIIICLYAGIGHGEKYLMCVRRFYVRRYLYMIFVNDIDKNTWYLWIHVWMIHTLVMMYRLNLCTAWYEDSICIYHNDWINIS